ncbi:hypothetical protein B7494_g6338 [Chlorociboria aeruginascens]|nr:hypothetical protein B7494_g6338 [Chlorociboria aeruginascens]
MSEMKQIPMDEVLKHNNKADLWVVIHHNVYDVSNYLEDHPGGLDALLEVAGQDSTATFEDVGHSVDARETMEGFLVGRVEGTPDEEDEDPSLPIPKPDFQKKPADSDFNSESKLITMSRASVKVAMAAGVTFLCYELSAHAPVFGWLHHQHGGFWKGFLLSSVTTMSIGAGAGLWLENALSRNNRTPYSYPAHFKPSISIAKPITKVRGYLKQEEYQKLPLVRKDKLSSNTYRFVFKLPTANTILGLPIGQHISIRAHIDGKTVSRSYTPVSNNSDLGELRLVIKMYSDGELTGRYLQNLNTGDEVEVRGPKGAMRYRKGMVKELGMIAGGTGITPMYQLIRAICEEPTDTTRITLLYGNNTEPDILLREQLDNFAAKYPENFNVDYVISKPSKDWTHGTGYVTKDLVEKKFPRPSADSRPVAILGGGVLGRRIACTWAAGGWDVRIRDPSSEQRNGALHYIENNVASYPFNGSAPGKALAFEDLAEAVKDAWTVIEAVPEKLPLKIDTFAALEKFAPKDAILASNSSSYKSSEMLEKVGKDTRQRILNTHYMMPPDNRIVELMTDGETDEDIFPFYVERLKEVGMSPIVARKESTGFVFNRVWAAIKRECLTILAEGVSVPEELDRVWVEMFSNGKVGPCAMMDAVGLYMLDIGLNTISDPIHSGRIVIGSPDGQELRTIVSGQILPDGLDISLKTGRIYWTNMGIPTSNDGLVQSCKLDGSDIQTVISAGAVHTPKQLVIDQENEKLYFCDREGLRVMRSNLDGSNHETLVQTGDWQNKADAANQMNWCVGISVNTTDGKFYWTQKGLSKGGKGRIFRANIKMPEGETASNRSDIELLLSGLPEPIDLEISKDTQTLFWTDRGDPPMGNSLNSIKLSGLKDLEPGSRKNPNYDILARQLHEAIGLKIDDVNKHIYLTDLGGTVYRYGIDGKDKKKVYDEECAFSGIGLAHL